MAIKSAEEAPDFVPDMSPLARRLARRCWPGPVTIVVDNEHQEGLTKQLPREVRELVAPNGTIGLRVPANDMSQDVLRMLTGPIVLTSANRSGSAGRRDRSRSRGGAQRRCRDGARRRPLPLRAAIVGRAN